MASHSKDNTVVRPSHIYDDNTYTQKEGLDIATRTRLLYITVVGARTAIWILWILSYIYRNWPLAIVWQGY